MWSGAANFGGIKAYNPHVCKHNSEDHICFHQGEGRLGYARGNGLILDSTYDVVRMVRPGGSLSGIADMHEYRLADDGRTALMTIYQTIPYDLSPFGITDGFGWIVEAVFQEVNVETGEVVFEWRSCDHRETSPYEGRKILPGNTLVGGFGVHPITPWDYFHINSIDKDEDGDYLISSRHMSSLFKLSKEDGHIIWQLAGDTELPYQKDFNFSSQHDARWLHHNKTHSTISLFDNADNAWKSTAQHSRGLIIEVDHEAETATEKTTFNPPRARPGNQTDPLSAGSQGNLQVLASGNAFVGWGEYPYFSEHASSGEVVLWGGLARNNSFMMHYRAQKFNWSATPREDPTMFAYSRDGATTVYYVSWNGATEVARWDFYAADTAGGAWERVGSANRTGFETRFRVEGYREWSYAEAVDRDGNVLRKSTLYRAFVPGEKLRPACDEWQCNVLAQPAQPSKEEMDAAEKLNADDVDWDEVKDNAGAEGFRKLTPHYQRQSWWQVYAGKAMPQVAVGVVVLVIVPLIGWAIHTLYARYRGGLMVRGSYQKVTDAGEETK